MSDQLGKALISALIGQTTKFGAERQRADTLTAQLDQAMRRAANAEADLAMVQKTLDDIRTRGADFEQRYRTANQQYEHTLADLRKLRDEITAKDARIAELEKNQIPDALPAPKKGA